MLGIPVPSPSLRWFIGEDLDDDKEKEMELDIPFSYKSSVLI